MSMQRGGGGYVQRSSSAGLYEILDLLLDKGLVVDVFLRVSLVGIELLTVDARIVIASVDTYLRFAEAVNRLDLNESGGEGLPEIIENMGENGAASKTRGVLEGAKEKLFGDEEEEGGGNGSTRRQSGSSSSRSRSGSRSKAGATRGRS
ncbi:MAG: gas vesicle protein GvpJ [Solirubrobacteraceae bacterium]